MDPHAADDLYLLRGSLGSRLFICCGDIVAPVEITIGKNSERVLCSTLRPDSDALAC